METDADTETKEKAQPCMGVVIISVVAVIVVFLAILLTTSPQSYHRCPGAAVLWEARNYSNDTTILNVSEVMVVLLICEEWSPNRT